MAVERLTDYTRRIWTGLADDAPVPDMQVGDVIYYMDTSTCSIITGIPAPGSIDTEDLPDIGGGGGGGINELALMGSGTYVVVTAPGTRELQIPVSVPAGVCKRFAVYVTPSSGVSCTYAWTREYGLPNDVATVIPRAGTVAHQNTSNTKFYTSDTSYANNAMSAFLDNIANPSIIGVRRYSDAFQLPAGTYTWYMWGAIS